MENELPNLSTIKKEEYAFPHEQSNEHFYDSNTLHHGMTLRDYFAAKAMPGLIKEVSEANPNERVEDVFLHVAKQAYQIADSMLKQREQNGN